MTLTTRVPRSARLAALTLSMLALGACSTEVADTHPEQPVSKRQEAFKGMLRSFEPMGTMLKEGRYDPERFTRHAGEVAALKEAPWPHFGPDTNYPPTKALAAVWDRPEDFARLRSKFIATIDALVAAAASREQAQVRSAFAAAQDSCKACHRDFRK